MLRLISVDVAGTDVTCLSFGMQVQAQHPGTAQQQQAQQLAPQQQGPHFPYPHFAPVMPVMMPFGFNPYAPPMFPGNAYPAMVQAAHHGHAPPGQAFQGI